MVVVLYLICFNIISLEFSDEFILKYPSLSVVVLFFPQITTTSSIGVLSIESTIYELIVEQTIIFDKVKNKIM